MIQEISLWEVLEEGSTMGVRESLSRSSMTDDQDRENKHRTPVKRAET